MTQRSYAQRLAQRRSELRSLRVRIARQYQAKKERVPDALVERLHWAEKLVKELEEKGE